MKFKRNSKFHYNAWHDRTGIAISAYFLAAVVCMARANPKIGATYWLLCHWRWNGCDKASLTRSECAWSYRTTRGDAPDVTANKFRRRWLRTFLRVAKLISLGLRNANQRRNMTSGAWVQCTCSDPNFWLELKPRGDAIRLEKCWWLARFRRCWLDHPCSTTSAYAIDAEHNIWPTIWPWTHWDT